MWRISKLADYGAIVLTAMADTAERTFSAAEIGSLTGLPVPSVSKILKILLRERIVISSRGARGGYRLARPAAEISTIEILHALDGPLGMTECIARPGRCRRETGCHVRSHWQMVNRVMLDALEQMTLQQMITPDGATLMPVGPSFLRPPSLATGPTLEPGERS